MIKKFKKIFLPSNVAYAFLIAGCLLRSIQYLYNRSLWLDESMLALNIIGRSFLDLLSPLDNNQIAPLGFLYAVKGLTILFGNAEYVLRLFSFLCGMGSLGLFFVISRKILDSYAHILAMALFSFSNPLIYYASEFKQYSADLFFSLLLTHLFMNLRKDMFNQNKFYLFSFISSISIWFSYPAFFVSISLYSIILFHLLREKRSKMIVCFSLCMFMFFVSLIICYCLNISINYAAHGTYMLNYWKNAFMPLPLSLSSLFWISGRFEDFFHYTCELQFAFILSIFYLSGCWALYGKNKNHFFMLFLPTVSVLIASSMKVYPFADRLLIFSIPSAFIFLSTGISVLSKKIKKAQIIIYFAIIAFIIISKFSSGIIYPRYRGIRPILEYVDAYYQSGDVIFISYYAQYDFRYYQRYFQHKNVDYRIGPIFSSSKDLNRYIKEFKKLSGNKRVWFIWGYTTAIIKDSDFEADCINELNKLGKNLEIYDPFKEGSAYLYNLTKEGYEKNK